MDASIARNAVTLSLGGLLVAAPAGAFEGRYAAGAPGYEQSLTVSRTGSGYRGKASVATRGCVGEFEGAGRVRHGRLVLRSRLDGRECRLVLSRPGASGLKVDEDGCLTFHGTACEFAGSYKRQAR